MKATTYKGKYLELFLRGNCRTFNVWTLPARIWSPLGPNCCGQHLVLWALMSVWQAQHVVRRCYLCVARVLACQAQHLVLLAVFLRGT